MTNKDAKKKLTLTGLEPVTFGFFQTENSSYWNPMLCQLSHRVDSLEVPAWCGYQTWFSSSIKTRT